jgi:hypothetical protein
MLYFMPVSRKTSILMKAFMCLHLILMTHGLKADELKTRNVILVTLDGLRWQEVFMGADPQLIHKEHGMVRDVKRTRAMFWREDKRERREILMPFLWKVVARQGQLYGNRAQGSMANLQNAHRFSYPGYNEILTGVPDPSIDSNAKRPNPNRTVLEWLHQDKGYQGEVAAFCAWDVFPYILNTERSGIPVMAGWNPLPEPEPNRPQQMLNALLETTTREWPNVTFDSLVVQAAMEHLKRHKPRLLYLALGETDDWAHDGRYDHVLEAARASDQAIAQIWRTLQGMNQYRDKTTLIITVDHGRGTGQRSWRGHGAKVDGAEEIWMAFLGPDTPALGMRKDVPSITAGQVAASVAAFLGEDYRSVQPKAPPAVIDAISQAE